jgi:arylformamidase
MQLIDLSLAVGDGSLSYPGTTSGITIEDVGFEFPGATLSRFSHFDVHCGTHLDAPLHFVSGGCDIASLPLVFADIALVRTHTNPIAADVLRDCPSLRGKAVVFSTGWECHAGTRRFFEGFPVLTPAVADLLVAHGAALVGLDSPSVDAEHSGFPVHRILLSAGIPIVEGLVNLASLASAVDSGCRVRLATFPLRIRNVEGSPVRAVAIAEPA